jgi:adenine deaminase
MDRNALLHTLAVSRGEIPADLILRNGRVVNVFTGEIMHSDVVIAGESIAALHTGYESKQDVDLKMQYVVPGLIDTHVHIESSLCTPTQFAKAVIPHGVTTVIADPHEIANVAGIDGIDYMLSASDNIPLTVFINLPSCVPATHMGTAADALDVSKLLPLTKHPRILGLAEFMNVPGAVLGMPGAIDKLIAFHNRNIDGHAPSVTGEWLQAYISAGPSTDHESTSAQEALEKASLGMYVLVREATGAKNVADIVPIINQMNASRFAFSTDDRHPNDLVNKGSIDNNIRVAVHHGLDPVLAVRLATLNGAEVYDLHDRGAIGPGRRADIVITPSLEEFEAVQVYIAGKLVAEKGCMVIDWQDTQHISPRISESIHVNTEKLSFSIPAQEGKIRVIGIIPKQLLTEELICHPLIRDGQVVSDTDHDILKLAVVERHKNTGNVGLGFVHGMGLKAGAVAGSIGHDCHNITVVGTNDADMHQAVRRINEIGGGLVVIKNRTTLAELMLPIGGIMSNCGIRDVHSQVETVLKSVKSLGSTLNDPLMHLNFLALEVIPKLKLTDMGLVDVDAFDFVSLWVR